MRTTKCLESSLMSIIRVKTIYKMFSICQPYFGFDGIH